MTRRERVDPADLTPREARDRYLRRRRSDSTEQSIDGWYYRLKLWAEWCEQVGIDLVGDLQRYDLDEYYEFRSADIAPTTLEGEMYTLKKFVEYLESLGAVEDNLSESVQIPDLDSDERSSDSLLRPEAARALLNYYRNSPVDYGTRAHALIELLWMTGARQGGIRSLDKRDFYHHEGGSGYFVSFRHRPSSDTGLKNKMAGERPVALPDPAGESVQHYIADKRHDVRDENGREPLLASTQGRPTPNTVRVWCYLATLPCIHSPCPHGRERETCTFTERDHASKCPSSRPPHDLRTGAITWMLNLGWPPEDIAERVNADIDTIEQHYDKADLDERRRRQRDRMERRRRTLVNEEEFINVNA